MKVFFQESRTSIIMASRQQLFHSLLKDLENLDVKSESLGMECETPDLSLDLELVDYVIKVVPKGRPCQLVSNKASIVIRDLKNDNKVSLAIQLPSFDFYAIYEPLVKTYWVTKINSLKSYNYKNISSQVSKHLQTAAFPSGVIYQGNSFNIKFLSEITYSPKTFKEIYQQYSLTCKYIDILPKVDESRDKFRVYSQEFFHNKSLRFYLKASGSFLYTSDGLSVLLKTPSDLEDGKIYAIKFKYKDMDKVERLFKVMSDSSKTNSMDNNFNEEVEVMPSSVTKLKKNQVKYASRKLLTFERLMNKLDFEIHRTEYKKIDESNESIV